jgi:hypothetical protein
MCLFFGPEVIRALSSPPLRWLQDTAGSADRSRRTLARRSPRGGLVGLPRTKLDRLHPTREWVCSESWCPWVPQRRQQASKAAALNWMSNVESSVRSFGVSPPFTIRTKATTCNARPPLEEAVSIRRSAIRSHMRTEGVCAPLVLCFNCTTCFFHRFTAQAIISEIDIIVHQLCWTAIN